MLQGNNFWNPPSAARYILQTGGDKFPKGFDKLPSDIPFLKPGDWKWSSILNGWIGFHRNEKENILLYELRIK